jgi:hypothetical protein
VSGADDDLLTRWFAEAAGEDRTIARVPRDRPIEASFGQRGMWIAQHMRGPSDAAFTMRHAYRIRGPLSVPALSSALDDLVARHETLRTVFRLAGGDLVQIVRPAAAMGLEIVTMPPGAAAGDWLREQMRALYRIPFDLAAGPPVRARLFAVDTDEWVLMLVIHHIANDGWSMQVLHRDLAELYAARLEARPASLPRLPVQPADFAVWERERHRAGAFDADLAYWRARLAGATPLSGLPGTRSAGRVPDPRGRRLEATLPAGVAAGVEAVARAGSATPFLVLLAAFQAALAGWSGQRDTVIGTAVAGRPLPETEDLVGPFAAVLPLRSTVDPDASLCTLVDRSRAMFLEAQEHEVPMDLVVAACQTARERVTRPLMEVSVSSHLGFEEPLALYGLEVTYLPPEEIDPIHALAVYLWSTGHGSVRVAIDYPERRFESSAIRALLDSYLRTLALAAAAPDVPMSRVATQGAV